MVRLYCHNQLMKKIIYKDTYNDFEKSVYDGLQLAFKITAKFYMDKLVQEQVLI